MKNYLVQVTKCGSLSLYFLSFLTVWSLSGCSSPSILPDSQGLKVSRVAPKGCNNLGPVSGATGSVKGSAEEALNDMKKDAANKGATHLVVLQYSPQQTAVTGEAYQCL